jgi:predicted GIY-YIG superfamily endonuclease
MKEIIRDNEICIYILTLEVEKYYVVQTNKIEQRLNEYFNGQGANFTKKYKPINLIRFFKKGTKNNKKGLLYETFITLLVKQRYGWQNVKGGKLLNMRQGKIDSLSLDSRIKLIKKQIRLANLIG